MRSLLLFVDVASQLGSIIQSNPIQSKGISSKVKGPIHCLKKSYIIYQRLGSHFFPPFQMPREIKRRRILRAGWSHSSGFANERGLIDFLLRLAVVERVAFVRLNFARCSPVLDHVVYHEPFAFVDQIVDLVAVRAIDVVAAAIGLGMVHHFNIR